MKKIKLEDPKIEYVECDCHTELVQLQYWKDDDLNNLIVKYKKQ